MTTSRRQVKHGSATFWTSDCKASGYLSPSRPPAHLSTVAEKDSSLCSRFGSGGIRRYKLNSYHSIMKLAVVFLCLGITCLVDANAGGPKPGRWTEEDAHDYAKSVYHLCGKLEKLKTVSESERKARQLCIIQEVVSILTTLSVRLGCTLREILSLAGFSSEAIELVLENDFLAVLDLLDLEAVVTSILLLVEGILAHAGYLLQTILLQIHNLLGSGNPLPSIFYALHRTIAGILASLRSTPLGYFLASISAALGGVLGGLTEGLGGIGHATGLLSGIGGLTGGLLRAG